MDFAACQSRAGDKRKTVIGGVGGDTRVPRRRDERPWADSACRRRCARRAPSASFMPSLDYAGRYRCPALISTSVSAAPAARRTAWRGWNDAGAPFRSLPIWISNKVPASTPGATSSTAPSSTSNVFSASSLSSPCSVPKSADSANRRKPCVVGQNGEVGPETAARKNQAGCVGQRAKMRQRDRRRGDRRPPSALRGTQPRTARAGWCISTLRCEARQSGLAQQRRRGRARRAARRAGGRQGHRSAPGRMPRLGAVRRRVHAASAITCA